MRKEGEKKWLFISHVHKMRNPDVARLEKIKIKIKGEWNPKIYDTLTGGGKGVRCRN